ncbi:MAG: ATP-binding cassette domain-containing protein [Kiritimatiellae bacterium]|nr:ATP-binding cassette domain-containing protein [Kiritimatiellia bacterium]
MPLLNVQNLHVSFHTHQGVIKAVNNVSFSVEKGETVGIVGESGCGKSVTCYSLLGLIPQPPGKIEKGSALFDGIDLLHLPPHELRKIRGKRISMIFQDPMSSLNPYLKVSTQLIEPLLVHEQMDKKQALKQSIQTLEKVGIPNAPHRIHDYPHEFSGGMRQRVMIAMALLTKPEILIADEPTTSLDVTFQSQILELLKRLQKEYGMAIIFITHDLGVIAHISNQVMVMYAGRIVESARTKELFKDPKHPYTSALMKSIPAYHKKGDTLYTIPGLPPHLSENFNGCPFTSRCEYVEKSCETTDIALTDVGMGHLSACTKIQNKEINFRPQPIRGGSHE